MTLGRKFLVTAGTGALLFAGGILIPAEKYTAYATALVSLAAAYKASNVLDGLQGRPAAKAGQVEPAPGS